MNPPGNPRAHYYTGPEPGPDPDAWLAEAERHPGTWWTHWAEWSLAHCPADARPPAALGNAAFPVLAPAPGRYVGDRL